ncbi:hypothetical protein LB565_15285 [Mesorhizobium sp. CA14]|uniref:hypothetical protein n=1 Tax=Mesorhizobium sp. CA14 TaxID=2876642 RepID=UPI001CCDE3D2|nr:hypothetical protein [Mesorhizobium sp. CA14]MBZ9849348.1 hypothetical protein [Mesorhizobium sp. CA14]
MIQAPFEYQREIAMMADVAITLGIVVALAVLLRKGPVAVFDRFGSNAARISTLLEIGTGLFLFGAALRQVLVA